MDTPIIPTKPPVLTSSSLLGANNVLFTFEKYESSSSSSSSSSSTVKAKPKIVQESAVKPKTCKTCQKKGHSWKECPTPDINKKCTNCNKIGHIAQNCKFIIMSFAKYQPPKPEPRPRRSNENNNNNRDNKFNKNQTTQSPPSPTLSSDIVVTNDSPKQINTSPKQETTSPTMNSSNTKNNNIPPIVFEQLKCVKDIVTRQLFIVNPESGWTIPDNLPEVARQSSINSVCLPAIIKDNKLDASVTQCIKSLHACGVQAPLVFNQSTLISEHPEWCNADGQTLDIANKEFQSYFLNCFGSCLKQLVEMRSDVGPMDGFFFDFPSSSSQCVIDLKQDLINLIRDVHVLDKTKKQPPNKPIHQVVFFNSTTQEKTSNLLKLNYNSKSEFSILSRYQYSTPTIGEVSITKPNSKSFKSFDTVWYECSQSLILSNRFSIKIEASQISNKNCVQMIDKLFKSVIDKENYCKNAKLVCDVGVCVPNNVGADNNLLNSLCALLEEFNYQFNFIQQPINKMEFSELCKYRVLILPDHPVLNGDGWTTLQKYIDQGGALLVTGDASLDSVTSNFSLSTAGMKYTKQQEELKTLDSLSIAEKKNSKSVYIPDPNANISMLQLSGRNGTLESTANDTTSLLNVTMDQSSSSAILYASGQRTVCCAHPLFTQYYESGDRAITEIFKSLMRILLPDPVVYLSSSNRGISTTVCHQSVAHTKSVEGYNRYLVHLLNADCIRIGNNECYEVGKDVKHFSLSVNIPKGLFIESVVAAGDIEKELKYKSKGNQISIEIPSVSKHSIIVINFKQ